MSARRGAGSRPGRRPGTTTCWPAPTRSLHAKPAINRKLRLMRIRRRAFDRAMGSPPPFHGPRRPRVTAPLFASSERPHEWCLVHWQHRPRHARAHLSASSSRRERPGCDHRYIFNVQRYQVSDSVLQAWRPELRPTEVSREVMTRVHVRHMLHSPRSWTGTQRPTRGNRSTTTSMAPSSSVTGTTRASTC